MTIGDRVAEIRKDSKLNQSEFAESINTSRSHLANVEKGRKELSSPLRKLICFAFSVNEDWLLTGEGEKYNSSIEDRFRVLESYYEGKDKSGVEKLDAFDLAAELYSIYPSISLSCESLGAFLSLFNSEEFCRVFNTIALAYRHQLELLEGKEIYTFLKTAVDLAEKQVITPLDMEIQEAALKDYSNHPTTKYFTNLKKGLLIERSVLDNPNKINK